MRGKGLLSLHFFITFVFLLTLVLPAQAFAGNGKGGGKPGGEEEPPPQNLKQEIVYTALGDSIASGDNAFGEDYSYTEIFRDELSATYQSVVFHDLAVSGYDSSDLLAQINVEGSSAQTAIVEADIITISIGGNNILPCRGFNFSSIDEQCSQEGVDLFSQEWPQIMNVITGLNNHAEIYVNTIYNPYPGDDANYSNADSYITQINNIITSQSLERYNVVDVYTAFLGTTGKGKHKSWKVCEYTYFCNWIRDPHPNDTGHNVIAGLHQVPIIEEEMVQ